VTFRTAMTWVGCGARSRRRTVARSSGVGGGTGPRGGTDSGEPTAADRGSDPGRRSVAPTA